MRKFLLGFILVFSILANTNAQTFSVNHQIPWATTNQYMWGPNGTPFTVDFDYSLFHFLYDTTMTFGDITNILGGQFGAEFDLAAYLEMGSTFSIHGFDNGWVDVAYPVDIELTFPSAGTAIPGQYATINSDYTVLPGWDLSTHFPQTGVISLDLDFGMSMDLSGEVCFIGCAPINLISFSYPLDSIVIFEVNSYTGLATYPCINGGMPAICQDTVIPIVLNNIGGIGLDLYADVPYIQTTDTLGTIDKCLYAYGDDEYLQMQLDIVQFLLFMSDIIPPPAGPALANLLSYLSGTIDLGSGMTLTYDLLSAFITLTNTLQQDFTFCPTLWTELDFPMDLEYLITDPLNGNMPIDSGYNDTIIFQVGHDCNIIWPCYGVLDLDAGIRHWMTNDFTNHTWDSLAFDFTLTAFEFELNFPSFPVAPATSLPELCVDLPVDGSQSGTNNICVPMAETPEIANEMVDLSIHIGPLIDFTIPIGWVPLTWFNQTWELEGFQDSIFPDVSLSAGPVFTMSLVGDTVICYGDSTGLIIANGQNGAPQYTFDWSAGVTNINNWSSDSILVTSGTYYVTVSDGGGCTQTDSIIIVDNPEMFIQLTSIDVNCFGDSTGEIHSNVWGGTPGYTYLYNPGGGTNNDYLNIPAGFYTLVVTDSLGCTKEDTITVFELHPHPPINFSGDPTLGCQPLAVQFDETNPSAGNTYYWEFGDGQTSTANDPLHVYDTAGTFDVYLQVVNQYNCASEQLLDDYIIVYPKPVASFYANPQTVYTSDDPTMTIDFFNDSYGDIAWFWDFGDNGTSAQESPTHSYGEEGEYNVMLIVTSDMGCLDTAYLWVEAIDNVLVFPNVVTPNNDGYNDVFKILNVEKYPESVLIIYNRWGTKVFEASPYLNNWSADEVADGTYYFVFKYEQNGEEVQGTITVIK